jgi:hypothetical protein
MVTEESGEQVDPSLGFFRIAHVGDEDVCGNGWA